MSGNGATALCRLAAHMLEAIVPMIVDGDAFREEEAPHEHNGTPTGSTP